VNRRRNAGFGAAQPVRITASNAPRRSSSVRRNWPLAQPPYATTRSTRSGLRAAYASALAAPPEMPSREQRSTPAASITVSRSSTQRSSESSPTSRSDIPQPRRSYRTTVFVCPSASSQWRQTSLSQSNSRWVSQFEAFTIDGPRPCLAYARRTPSDAVQNRISCSKARLLYLRVGRSADLRDAGSRRHSRRPTRDARLRATAGEMTLDPCAHASSVLGASAAFARGAGYMAVACLVGWVVW
jgi:hypothetical protein